MDRESESVLTSSNSKKCIRRPPSNFYLQSLALPNRKKFVRTEKIYYGRNLTTQFDIGPAWSNRFNDEGHYFLPRKISDVALLPYDKTLDFIMNFNSWNKQWEHT